MGFCGGAINKCCFLAFDKITETKIILGSPSLFILGLGVEVVSPAATYKNDKNARMPMSELRSVDKALYHLRAPGILL